MNDRRQLNDQPPTEAGDPSTDRPIDQGISLQHVMMVHTYHLWCLDFQQPEKAHFSPTKTADE